IATHTWPELVKAPQKSFGATRVGSTSGRTIAGSLPPSSSVTRFKSSAAARMIFFPVGTLPVNEIFRTAGCAVIQAPTSSLPPRTLTTPAGTAARGAAPNASEGSGVQGGGLAAPRRPGSGAAMAAGRSSRVGGGRAAKGAPVAGLMPSKGRRPATSSPSIRGEKVVSMGADTMPGSPPLQDVASASAPRPARHFHRDRRDAFAGARSPGRRGAAAGDDAFGGRDASFKPAVSGGGGGA